MKILQVVRQYFPGTGGMETYVSSLCRELKERGHRSDVATLGYLFKSRKPLPPYQNVAGIDVIRLPSLGTARYFVAPRLLQLLPRYDLIHVHGVDFFIDLLGSGRRFHGKPVVLSTHGGFFHTAWFPSLKRAYFHTVTRMALHGVDRVIASSPRDEAMFAPVAPRLTLVANGIDFSGFAGLEKRIDGEKLLFIGRISKNKRVDRLIEMMAALGQTRPQARLTVVGPDWEGLRGGLEARMAALGIEDSVTFTGELPHGQMLDRLSQARLFVSAAENEAFGLSAMEAMASGTVPVLNDIEAFRGFVHSGENGFLTDFSTPATAAAAVAAALELPDGRLAKIGARAQATASRYDWGRVAEDIIEVYRQVLADHEDS
ncbi:MAG: glycosyltransferase family 4 protein [Actinomycetota bacterium]|nr:glycosyltransferase family 4 protein [Actinomycetota bacterium]MDA8166185.1 glycosyltransferase family 4 protein [Actinomycetota bacterium]